MIRYVKVFAGNKNEASMKTVLQEFVDGAWITIQTENLELVVNRVWNNMPAI